MNHLATGVAGNLPPVFDRKVLADALGTTPRHLMDNQDKGPPFFRVGRKVRFNRDAVLAWIESNTVSAA